MFKGEYKGKNVERLNKKVLILGESHHGEVDTTVSVVKDYHNFPQKKEYQFFHKIAQSFNVDKDDVDDEFSEFWDYVYFGNYIDKSCGIGDSKAKNFLSENENRKKCNNKLFDFINNNNIDVVFVFSRLAYRHLPSLSQKHKNDEKLSNADNGNLKVGTSRDWIACYRYLANIEHKNVDVVLNRDITVYNMRHPSARCGYRVENYIDVLGKLFEDLKK